MQLQNYTTNVKEVKVHKNYNLPDGTDAVVNIKRIIIPRAFANSRTSVLFDVREKVNGKWKDS